jgi:hypothetical protein
VVDKIAALLASDETDVSLLPEGKLLGTLDGISLIMSIF